MIRCPYCDIDIDLDAVESEDGCCPECGAIVSVTTFFNDEQLDEDDEHDEDLDDNEDFSVIDEDD